MNKALEFLQANPIGSFATVGIDGGPKVRPFGFFFEHEGKLWFCTSSDKPVYEEIMQNPNIEFCVTSPKMDWLRLSGKVVFSDSMDMKKALFAKTDSLAKLYGSPDNPIFKPFYLENAKAVICSMGKEPEMFQL